MRPLLTVSALLVLAGCAAPTELEGAATSTPIPVEPFAAEGTVFLPPTGSQERAKTLLPFPVNATGSTLTVHAVLGSKYGPLDAPPVLTDVLLELRAPDGTVLAEGALDPASPEAHLEASAAQTGEHVLALLSYGGSDEEANGDYVAWRIEVTPAAIS